MALTTRVDGSGSTNIIKSGWFNDFLNLFTGVMNDQPITFKKTGGGTTVTIECDSSTNPLLVYESDGATTGLSVDHAGNVVIGSNLTVKGSSSLDNGNITSNGSGTLTVATQVNFGPAVSGSYANIGVSTGNTALEYAGPQAGASHYGHIFFYWSGSATITVFSIGNQLGSALSWVDSVGHFQDNGLHVPRLNPSSGTAGLNIFTGTTTPTGAGEGDIWVKA